MNIFGETKHKKLLRKSKKQWVVVGVTSSAMILAGLASSGQVVNASESETMTEAQVDVGEESQQPAAVEVEEPKVTETEESPNEEEITEEINNQTNEDVGSNKIVEPEAPIVQESEVELDTDEPKETIDTYEENSNKDVKENTKAEENKKKEVKGIQQPLQETTGTQDQEISNEHGKENNTEDAENIETESNVNEKQTNVEESETDIITEEKISFDESIEDNASESEEADDTKEINDTNTESTTESDTTADEKGSENADSEINNEVEEKSVSTFGMRSAPMQTAAVTNVTVADTTAPRILELNLDKETYHAGETVTGQVIVEDENKIDNMFIYFRNTSDVGPYSLSDGIYSNVPQLENGNSVFNFEMQLPEAMGGTSFYLSSLDVEDEALNATDLSYNNGDTSSPISFNVVNTVNPDSTSPKIIDISLDRETYHAGETVTGQVIVEDENKIDNMFIYFRNTSDVGPYSLSDGIYSNVPQLENGNSVFNFEMQLPETMGETSFYLSSLDVEDEALNATDLSYNNGDTSSPVSFNVVNTVNPDSTSPKIIDISLDREAYHPGEIVTGQVIVEDENKIDNMFIYFRNTSDAGPYSLSDGIYSNVPQLENGNSVFNFEMQLPETMGETSFYLSSLDVEDEALNATELSYNNRDFPYETSFSIVFEGERITNETRTEEVPYETITQENNNLPDDVSNVIQNGVPGTRTIVEEVTIVDGIETNREIISNEVTTAPVTEIIEVGTQNWQFVNETYTEQIDFEADERENAQMEIGDSFVIQEGSPGLREVTERITYVNGQEINRDIISDVILTSPVSEIIEYGTSTSAELEAQNAESYITNNFTIVDSVTNNELINTTLLGNDFDARLDEFVNNLNSSYELDLVIDSIDLIDSSRSAIQINGEYVSLEIERDYDVLVSDSSGASVGYIPQLFLPEGTIYNDSDSERLYRTVSVSHNNRTLYRDTYISNETIDDSIRKAMSNIDSQEYYFDNVDVSRGLIFTSGPYSGPSATIKISVNARPVSETISYETIREVNTNLQEDEEIITQPGQNGVRIVDEYGNILSTESPVNEIIEYGPARAAVPYETVREVNVELAENEEQIVQPGQNGVQLVDEEGNILSATEPTNEIVEYGPIHQAIPYGTERTVNVNLEENEEVVVREGQNGVHLIDEAGNVISTEDPVNKLIEYGPAYGVVSYTTVRQVNVDLSENEEKIVREGQDGVQLVDEAGNVVSEIAPVNEIVEYGPNRVAISYETIRQANTALEENQERVVQEGINGLQLVDEEGNVLSSVDPVNEVVEYGPARVTIPYETERVPDVNLNENEEEIVKPGQNGVKLVDNNGNVLSTVQQVNEVIEYGPARVTVPYETDRVANAELDEGNEHLVQAGHDGLQLVDEEGNVLSSEEPVNAVVEYGPARVAVPYETDRIANVELDEGNEQIVQPGQDGVQLVDEEGNILSTMEPINEIVEFGPQREPAGFETIYQPNVDLEAGQTAVVQEGQPGVVTIDENGKEVVLVSPVDTIIGYGEETIEEPEIEDAKLDIPEELENADFKKDSEVVSSQNSLDQTIAENEQLSVQPNSDSTQVKPVELDTVGNNKDNKEEIEEEQESESYTEKVAKEKVEGQTLPDTATSIWSVGLLGFVSLLGGGLTSKFKKKDEDESK